jgi:hypothetical protein
MDNSKFIGLYTLGHNFAMVAHRVLSDPLKTAHLTLVHGPIEFFVYHLRGMQRSFHHKLSVQKRGAVLRHDRPHAANRAPEALALADPQTLHAVGIGGDRGYFVVLLRVSADPIVVENYGEGGGDFGVGQCVVQVPKHIVYRAQVPVCVCYPAKNQHNGLSSIHYPTQQNPDNCTTRVGESNGHTSIET